MPTRVSGMTPISTLASEARVLSKPFRPFCSRAPSVSCCSNGRSIAVMTVGEQCMANTSGKRVTKAETAALERDNAETYNSFKEFEGRRYTGMKIGRGHKWYYDPGVWSEKKITPDEWQGKHSVTHTRERGARGGAGVPVGTQYHWYIVAHQNVTKLNANDYTTSLTGLKF